MRQLDDSHDRDTAATPAAPQREDQAAESAPVPSAERAQGLVGSSMDAVKTQMGQVFGTDFSGVNVKQDGRADALGAQAYTQGETVHLAAGRGTPSTREGTALLGHELAHVQQQRAGRVAAPQAKGSPINADEGLEAEADAAGAAAVRGEPVPSQLIGHSGAASGAGQAKAEGQPIQMFGSKEHQTYGDEGAKAAGYNGTYKQDTDHMLAPVLAPALGVDPGPDFRFELTHGDIVMLSGDYFDARETDLQGNPVPDNFFKLASTPSPLPGCIPGTQDEIIYAVKHARPDDRRFKPMCSEKDPLMGIWSQVTFSQQVKDAVEARYLRLADSNTEHFANPKGPGSGGPKSGNRQSAGGSYRALHEDAILRAHQAKKDGKGIDEPMAREAAAEHFLTDGFAAGHLRTPRASIAEYWNGKYPLFFENLKKTIAQDVAIYMNAHETNAATIMGSVLDIMKDTQAQIDEKTASLPEFGFDDIVSLITHDMDNARGLWVTNELQMSWKTFGDSHGGVSPGAPAEQDATKEKVETAVRLGVSDIQQAHAADASMSEQEVIAHVRSTTAAPAKPGANYGAEQMMPFPDASRAADNGTQCWKQSNFQTLWGARVRSDQDETFGLRILQSMVPGGEFGDKLSGLAAKFPETKPVWHDTVGSYQVYLGDLHPQAAYNNSFLAQMTTPSTTRAKIQQIIDFDPGRGQANSRTDDATRADLDRLHDKGQKMADEKKPGPDGKPADRNTLLRGLTVEQRIHYINNLESWQGIGVSEGEQTSILELFQTAPSGERKELFRRLEGHSWQGHFKEGWTVRDDDLWDSLDGWQLKSLQRLLNES